MRISLGLSSGLASRDGVVKFAEDVAALLSKSAKDDWLGRNGYASTVLMRVSSSARRGINRLLITIMMYKGAQNTSADGRKA